MRNAPTAPPRILFLEQYAVISGGQRVLLSLLDGLTPEYACQVILPGKGALSGELEKRGIPYGVFPIGYYSLGKKNQVDIIRYLARLPCLTFKLVRLLQRSPVALVYANAARAFPWATLACALTRTPLVWHVHSIFDRGMPRFLCRYFGRNPWVKKIIAVSRAAQAPLADLADKVAVMYNAVDTAVFYPGNKQGPVRAALGLDAAPVIAMVGLLVEWKGVDDCLRAMAIVHRRFPHAKLLMVGDVLYEQRGQSYKNYLRRLAAELGLQNTVVWTGFRADVAAILREIDVLVLASQQPDPCPTVVLQAMASGAAVIATDFGGPAEIIADGQDGLLFPAGDYEVLARRIEFLLDRPGEGDRLGAAAARKIRASFENQEYVRDIRAVIAQARGRAAGSRYYRDEYRVHNPTWHAEDAAWKAAQIQKALPEDFLLKIALGVRLIDIGCGVGEILKQVAGYLEARGKSVQAEGYDLSPEALAQARKRFPRAQFQEQEFSAELYRRPDERITIALLIDILEHTADPSELLRAVGEASEHVICHLPLEDNFEVNCRGLKSRFTRTVGHVHFFNRQSALTLFREAGFEVEHEHLTCSDCSADYRLASPLRRWIAQPVRKFFFRLAPRFTAAVLGNCSLMVRLRPIRDTKLP